MSAAPVLRTGVLVDGLAQRVLKIVVVVVSGGAGDSRRDDSTALRRRRHRHRCRGGGRGGGGLGEGSAVASVEPILNHLFSEPASTFVVPTIGW